MSTGAALHTELTDGHQALRRCLTSQLCLTDKRRGLRTGRYSVAGNVIIIVRCEGENIASMSTCRWYRDNYAHKFGKGNSGKVWRYYCGG
jgi:hypothetical protein